MSGEPISLEFLLAATSGTAYRTAEESFCGAAIDGRAAVRGGLWFAIRGDRFDGHDFAPQAVEHGATGLVVARGRAADLRGADEVTVVEVDDTTKALGALARAYRLSLPELRVVGVTGSNGKTTTKELLAAILVAHAGSNAVAKTQGNLNNHLGLPLTLLRLKREHRFAVIEMGMSALGEIAYLAHLAAPESGAIVNVGPVHLEHLKSLDNVARAKGELFAALPPTGAAIFPDGDARLAAQAEASRAVRKIRFGTREGVEVRLESSIAGADGTQVSLRLPDGDRISGKLALLGAHNGINAACAAALAGALSVPATAIAAGLSAARAEKHRSQALEIGGRKILDDCYNASPPSTGAALETLAAVKGGARAVAVLGDMLELGPDENLLHRSIGERAAKTGLDLLVTVGERMRHASEGARAAGMSDEKLHHAASPEEAAGVAARATKSGDWILVKASRGMKLERVIDSLKARFDAAVQQDAATQQPRSG
jgi:UDP-N-acetylmuramoyl-tripeptide--D-alanyl-D-alanine ligase